MIACVGSIIARIGHAVCGSSCFNHSHLFNFVCPILRLRVSSLAYKAAVRRRAHFVARRLEFRPEDERLSGASREF